MPPVLSVPEGLVASTLRREGDEGQLWLANLPDLVESLLERWGCEIVGSAWHGEVAVVVPVRRSGQDAVLKVSYPHVSFDGEVAALRHFGGRAAVSLLAAAESESAVLLERVGPHTLASVTAVEQVIEIAGALARRLAVPAYDRAPSLAGTAPAWAQQLDRQRAQCPDALPSAAIARARQTIEALESDRTPTMLHGDLHASNVLAAVREPWLTIDPLGWRGTAAFDAFTVVAGRREDQPAATHADEIRARIRRYAAAADVDPELAEACCQARATSAYLHQLAARGNWFDPNFLRASSFLGLPV